MTQAAGPFISASAAAGGQVASVVAGRVATDGMTLRIDGEVIRAVTPAAALALIRCIDRVLQERDGGGWCLACAEYGQCARMGDCPQTAEARR